MDKEYVDETDTSVAWQGHESGLAVWPIGAFEQHGHHLPLASDNLLAEHFARRLAAELGAALLPLLPFGSSLEHTGFRGTLTLSPELQMALVRHMAGELQAQNFTRLVIVSGHGGNFGLYPAARAINREDRPLKVLVADVGDHMVRAGGRIEGDLHSGELETSLLLALAPELVGDDRRDHSPDSSVEQVDLNFFGVGRLSSTDGTWGRPSRSSAEAGRELAEQVFTSMMGWVQQRLERFDEDPRYSGAGPLVLRPMTDIDIPLGMRLKEIAGWNQTPADWQLLLRCGAAGSFVAIRNGVAVGTVTTVAYEDKFRWVGMVLVDPEHRRRGIGGQLLAAAIDSAATPVRLDATPLGQKLYETLGFREEYGLARMEIAATPAPPLPEATSCRPATADDVERLAQYDAPLFGAARGEVLAHLQRVGPGYAWLAEANGELLGYCLGRPGSGFEQIGPVTAADEETAKALFCHALHACRGRAAIVDCLDRHAGFREWLGSLGFRQQRPYIRMVKGGDGGEFGEPARQFAIAGAELG